MLRSGGRYVVERVLCRGTMPLIEATDTVLGRNVILRTLVPALARKSRRRAHFLEDAAHAAQLRSPHIAPVLDLGEAQGASHVVPYVVMELPEGRSLRALIDAGAPRPLDWCVDVISQLCEALMHAHRHGVPQLGLRPDGAFVSDDGRVTVVPFGTIPIHGDTARRAALTLDDVAYLAPELVAGRASDSRADLFTLGVMAYELLTGQRPFQATSIPVLLLALLHEQPDLGLLPRDRRFPGLEALIARALARDPQERYRDAEALLLELESLACEATTPVPLPAGPAPDPELDALRALALAHAVADRAEQALRLVELLEQRAPGDPRNEELRAYLRTEGAHQNGEALLEVGRHQLAMGNFVTARAAAIGALSVRPCRTRARTLLLDVETQRHSEALRPRQGPNSLGGRAARGRGDPAPRSFDCRGSG